MSDEYTGSLTKATVIDSNGDKVGDVGQVFTDESGKPAFATVKTGWFGRHASVVPLQGAEIGEDQVRVFFTKDQIKDAPSLDSDTGLDRDGQDEVRRHYGLGALGAAATAGDAAAASSAAAGATGSGAGAPDATASYSSAATSDDISEPWTRSEGEEVEPGSDASDRDDSAGGGTRGEGWDDTPHGEAAPAAEYADPASGSDPVTAVDTGAETEVDRSTYSDDRPAAQSWAYEGSTEAPPAEGQTAEHQWSVPTADAGDTAGSADSGRVGADYDDDRAVAQAPEGQDVDADERWAADAADSDNGADRADTGFVGMGAAAGADPEAYESHDGSDMTDEERQRLNEARGTM